MIECVKQHHSDAWLLGEGACRYCGTEPISTSSMMPERLAEPGRDWIGPVLKWLGGAAAVVLTINVTAWARDASGLRDVPPHAWVDEVGDPHDQRCETCEWKPLPS